MNPILSQQFNKLETQRTKLLSEIKHLTAEKLNSTTAGRWSVGQVVAHLITTEKLSILYLNKKMQAIHTLDDTGVLEELKSMILSLSLWLPLKFKAPKVVVDNTPSFQSLEQLETEWLSIRHQLQDLLAKFSDDQIKRKTYKHPVAGKLNIVQALKSISDHIGHHQPQIKKILKQV